MRRESLLISYTLSERPPHSSSLFYYCHDPPDPFSSSPQTSPSLLNPEMRPTVPFHLCHYQTQESHYDTEPTLLLSPDITAFPSPHVLASSVLAPSRYHQSVVELSSSRIHLLRNPEASPNARRLSRYRTRSLLTSRSYRFE